LLPAGDPPGLPTEEEIFGRIGRENFKVASRLLPGALRTSLISYYGYARLVDFLGDEYAGDRLDALDGLEAQTHRALAGDTADLHPLVASAVATVIARGIDPSCLLDLIVANRVDQSKAAYATFPELVEYCRFSANPVGRFVLALSGSTDDQRARWSDAICTGLQLAEHWQDVVEDARSGRVYLPKEDLERFGVAVADLLSSPACAEWRALMVFEVARARRLLDEGRPLIPRLRGAWRWAVAGFWAGGHAALDAIAATDFDVTAPSLRPRLRRVARHMVVARAGSGHGC
jgi:squalene synthase HpnC